jgi:RNA polymerase sigma-70 factor (ECF subfamily)
MFQLHLRWAGNCHSSKGMNTTDNPGANVSASTDLQHWQCRSALLSSARAGDRQALAELVMPYATGLYRSGLRLTGNAHDAEDVRQETLLKTLSRLDQFAGAQTGPHDDMHAWVSRIARNASIDVIRRRREGKLFSLDQSSNGFEEPWAAQISSREANPEASLLRQETRRLLASAISTLPPDLRQVCLLMDVLNYSAQEVADRVGISNVAVRLRLFRARRKLREKLNQKFPQACQRAARARVQSSQSWAKRNHRVPTRRVIGFACGAACGGD